MKRLGLVTVLALSAPLLALMFATELLAVVSREFTSTYIKGIHTLLADTAKKETV